MEREDNQWREKFDRREQDIAALDAKIAECDRKTAECRAKMEKLRRTGRFQADSLESEMHKLLGVDAKILDARDKLTKEREKLTNNEAWMHYLITVGSAMVERYKEAPVTERALQCYDAVSRAGRGAMDGAMLPVRWAKRGGA